MKPFPSSHSGITIAKELNAITERWNIPKNKVHLLVHDSGTNMIKGLAEQKLKSIQQELNLPNQQLVQDVSTRWNSTYYLMERLLEQKRAVSLYST
ncbi:Zinc finger BED domain-containing protein 4 [Eumeta japonica]|uniref:Zinc finger BED domain-containing protein 4 n=1 Tax=Eumeta variegata TaxID=151549 RepID=A0A4C1U2J4_EUMVA|nr:Zinc finger BED domain-containing protein 4 [Eumeta japonica]